MAEKLRRWRALSWSDRSRLILMMLLGLPAMSASLRLFGYVRTRQWLERGSESAARREPSATDLVAAEDLGSLAAIAGRNGPISATCLRQSLLIYWLLRRRGLQPELKLGARKQAGQFHAHAWVVLAGRPLAQELLEHQAFEERA